MKNTPQPPGSFEYHPGGYGRHYPEDDGQYHGFLSVPESNTTVTVYADTLDELNAVCSLIAAAPDLLAAVKTAWDALDNLLDLRRERKADTGDAHEAIIEAHGLLGAAIAKATGNSQTAS